MLLTEPELRRLDNLASASAQETFTLGHSLTRLVVGREFHVPATAVRIAQFCETCGGSAWSTKHRGFAYSRFDRALRRCCSRGHLSK